MKKIAAESLIERLADWGVDTVFGLPGDGINGLMEALRRHQDRIRFVLVHHEEAAAFMATARTRRPPAGSACASPRPGPGGIHLLNGLYDAKLDHEPVLAITGMQETQLLGTGYQQEVHLEKLFDDVAEYNVMVAQSRVRCRRWSTSRSGTPWPAGRSAHITFPNDLQVADADADPWQASAPARTPATAPVLPRARRCGPRDDGPRGGRRRAQRRREGRRSWPAPAPAAPATRCWRSPSVLGARS